jgi:hypothetical protein
MFVNTVKSLVFVQLGCSSCFHPGIGGSSRPPSFGEQRCETSNYD